MASAFNTFLHNLLSDLRVELTEEFDRNFERKAFFDRAWKPIAGSNNRGSLMMRTGALRNSIESRVQQEGLQFTSNMPYAAIHNEGGELTVTANMKKFFWAMHYKASGAITKNKDGSARKTDRSARLSQEAGYWKSMALMKVGEKIKIPQRQFIGHHPRVDELVQQVADDNVQELATAIGEALQKIHK